MSKLLYFHCRWMLLLTALATLSSFSAEVAEDPLQPPPPPTTEQLNPPTPTEEQLAPAPAAEEELTPPRKPPRKRARGRGIGMHDHSNGRVEFGQDVVIAKDETVQDLVVIAGNVTVDGTVERSLVVVGGSAKINGQINDDLVTVLGSVAMGPEASVGNDAVVVGGTFDVDPQATIGGEQTSVSLGDALPDIVWLQEWFQQGLLLGRPFPPKVRWVWAVAGVFMMLYLAFTLVFPRPVRACVQSLEEQPVVSFLLGIVLFVVLGPLLFLLVVSVAGLLVIPFLFCALVVAAVLGKIAVYAYAGQQLGRQIRLSSLGLPLMLLLGGMIFYGSYMVPVLGFAMWGVATLLGLGAVLLAAFGSFRQESAPAYVPVQPVLRTATAGLATSPEGAAGMASGSPPMLLPAGDITFLPRVGFWRRLFATTLDFLLLGLLLPAIGPFFLGVWAAYYVGMWTWKGTSIGGIVMSIKVVRADGQPISFPVALVRSLSSFFSAFALFLGFFWAGWDREKQAWHDKIAGTVVVKVPKGMSLI